VFYFFVFGIPLFLGALCGYFLNLPVLAIVSCPAVVILIWMFFEARTAPRGTSAGLAIGLIILMVALFLLGAWITAAVVRWDEISAMLGLIPFAEWRDNVSEALFRK
jgi:type III secretory pathway component EscS